MASPALLGSRLTFRPELDGIRGIAVVLVVGQHWLPLSFPFGEACLTIFFALSGYLISGIAWHQRAIVDAGHMGRGRALWLFYCRRALRIFPAYYLTLAVCALLPLESVRQHWPWYLLHGSNILFFREQHWGEGSGHFWSLAMEEQFYLVWPLLLLFWPARHQVRLLTVLIAGAFVFRLVWASAVRVPFTFTLMPANVDAFAAGGLLRLLEGRLPARWPGYGRLLVLGWAAWVLICGAHLLQPERYDALFLVLGMGAAAAGATGLLGWVLNTPYSLSRRVLLHPVWQWLGTRSYSLYLYHLPLVVLYQRLVFRLLPAGALRDAWMSPWRMALVLAPVLLVLGGLSWRLLEQPFNAMKRFFPYEKRPQPQPVA